MSTEVKQAVGAVILAVGDQRLGQRDFGCNVPKHLWRANLRLIRVLMVRRGETAPRHPGAWTLPSGDVGPGESLPDALAREVFEEVDINFRPESKPFHSGEKAGVEVNYFLGHWQYANARGVVLKLNPNGVMENDMFRWMTLAEAASHGEDFVFGQALTKLIPNR